MLTAVWTVMGVLKIVGLVLLGLVGCLLVLLLLVLLVPIRYQARLSFQGGPKGQAGVSWLCYILWAGAVYEEKLTFWVRVLGIQVFRREILPGKKEKEEAEEGSKEPDTGGKKPPEKSEARAEGPPEETDTGGKKPPKGAETGTESSEERRKEAEEIREKLKGSPDKVWEEEMENCKAEKAESGSEGLRSGETVSGKSDLEEPKSPVFGRKQRDSGKKRRRKKKTRKSMGFSFRGFCDKLKKKLRRIGRRWKELKEKKDKGLAFIKDPANQRTFRLLKRQLWKLVKHILPGRISGRIRFGFEDPAKTGQILAAISPFYGWYAKNLEVIPVFEEALLEGEGRLRGRIRIGTLMMTAALMLFDKNFRALLKKLLRA